MISDNLVAGRESKMLQLLNKINLCFKNPTMVMVFLSVASFPVSNWLASLPNPFLPRVELMIEQNEINKKSKELVLEKYTLINEYFHVFESSDLAWLRNSCFLVEQIVYPQKCPQIRDIKIPESLKKP